MPAAVDCYPAFGLVCSKVRVVQPKGVPPHGALRSASANWCDKVWSRGVEDPDPSLWFEARSIGCISLHRCRRVSRGAGSEHQLATNDLTLRPSSGRCHAVMLAHTAICMPRT